MCEYCGDVVNNKNLYNGEYELLEIAYDKLSYFQFDGTVFTVGINYCPMCGRDFKTVNRIDDRTKSLYGRIEDEVNEGVG